MMVYTFSMSPDGSTPALCTITPQLRPLAWSLPIRWMKASILLVFWAATFQRWKSLVQIQYRLPVNSTAPGYQPGVFFGENDMAGETG